MVCGTSRLIVGSDRLGSTPLHGFTTGQVESVCGMCVTCIMVLTAERPQRKSGVYVTDLMMRGQRPSDWSVPWAPLIPYAWAPYALLLQFPLCEAYDGPFTVITISFFFFFFFFGGSLCHSTTLPCALGNFDAWHSPFPLSLRTAQPASAQVQSASARILHYGSWILPAPSYCPVGRLSLLKSTVQGNSRFQSSWVLTDISFTAASGAACLDQTSLLAVPSLRSHYLSRIKTIKQHYAAPLSTSDGPPAGSFKIRP
jgi:hypothetical protein